MQIYERVYEILKKKGMSQKEFSLKTGIPQSTISDWKGKKVNPTSDKIMTICEVLEVTPYEILTDGDGNMQPPVDYVMVDKNSTEYLVIEKIRNLSKDDCNRLLGFVDAMTK